MHPDSELLMKAILALPSEAEPFWRSWRAEINPETMSEDCVRLLPVLAPSPSWLAADPAKNLVLGIGKRAWTRNQVMLRALAETAVSLQRQGVPEVAVAGPPAWAIIHQAARRFRPVSFLELTVPRAKAVHAVDVLSQNGWMPLPNSISPEGDALDYVQGIWLKRKSGERLKLNWRLFATPPEFAADWESLPPAEKVEVQGVPLGLVPKEALFACALAGEHTRDDLDWRCDATMLLRSAKLDWAAVERYVRFAPEARMRLAALARESGHSIPLKLQREPARSALRTQWDLVRREYQVLTWTHRQPRSFLGFLQFLRQRWQAPALLLPLFGLFYLTRYTCFNRTGRGQ